MIWLIIVTGILITGVLGIPVGVGLGAIGLVILHVIVGGATSLAVNAAWNVFNDFVLSAVPLFILMGEILLISGASGRMYTAAAPVFRRVPGGLLHTNIVVCTMFGAVSGTSTSTAAAIGSVAYPELRKRGYDPAMTVGSLAAGGTQGLLIPPSVGLLIYGATQGVSIGKLFIAGIIPGMMMALLFMAFILIQAKRKPHLFPSESSTGTTKQVVIGLLRLWPIIGLVLSVLGTIYLGIATPTEAAGLGVIASIVVGGMWGNLNLRKLAIAARRAVITFGAVGLVIIGATILAQSISIMGLPSQVAGAIGASELSPYTVLILVVLLYLILGCFFDGISLLLMTLPVVFPVMMNLGFDPVWLGIIIIILVEIGMMTPPVGINLFVLVAVTQGEVSLADAARAALPYWLLLLFSVGFLTAFPQIILFLPNLM